MSTHDELKANAAGYVLGSLDPDERRAFASHLAGCAECSAEVASLQPVVGALATVVPQVTPRAELRDRILSGAGGAAKSRRSASETRVGGWLPLAAAIVIAVGAGVYVVRLQRQIGELQARFDQAQATTAVLAAPDLARIDLQGQPVAPDARARALWSRSRGQVVSGVGRHRTGADQRWSVDSGFERRRHAVLHDAVRHRSPSRCRRDARTSRRCSRADR
jgi:anti-sigma-K factor RskA